MKWQILGMRPRPLLLRLARYVGGSLLCVCVCVCFYVFEDLALFPFPGVFCFFCLRRTSITNLCLQPSKRTPRRLLGRFERGLLCCLRHPPAQGKAPTAPIAMVRSSSPESKRQTKQKIYVFRTFPAILRRLYRTLTHKSYQTK